MQKYKNIMNILYFYLKYWGGFIDFPRCPAVYLCRVPCLDLNEIRGCAPAVSISAGGVPSGGGGRNVDEGRKGARCIPFHTFRGVAVWLFLPVAWPSGSTAPIGGRAVALMPCRGVEVSG